MKKTVMSIVLLYILILLSSCDSNNETINQYVEKNFAYTVLQNDEEINIYVTGLSNEGRQKEFLVFPNEILNNNVSGIGYWRDTGFMTGTQEGSISSDVLERLYFNFDTSNMTNVGYSYIDNCYIVSWYEYNHLMFSDYKGDIIGYNIYSKYKDYYGESTALIQKIANVTFLYNYEEAPNDGYYWVDSYENSLIKYVPDDPTREGYTFDGWYKNSSCTEPWDFNVDKTGEEIIITSQSNYDSYTGISLYAKWK